MDFETVQNIIDWLNMPENQFKSELFVIRWEGYAPKISTFRLAELNDPRNVGFAATILQEHKKRKRRPGEEEDQETQSSGEEQ